MLPACWGGARKKQVPPTGDVKREVNVDLEVGYLCGQERRREISHICHSQKKQQKRKPTETEVSLPSEFKEISIAQCSGKLRPASVLSGTLSNFMELERTACPGSS